MNKRAVLASIYNIFQCAIRLPSSHCLLCLPLLSSSGFSPFISFPSQHILSSLTFSHTSSFHEKQTGHSVSLSLLSPSRLNSPRRAHTNPFAADYHSIEIKEQGKRRNYLWRGAWGPLTTAVRVVLLFWPLALASLAANR